ncbi:MAG: FG-GAP repeat protein [Anaerolineales bacterium]|nr:FG-GAP repeat protein [Anaerolineales bacterium]
MKAMFSDTPNKSLPAARVCAALILSLSLALGSLWPGLAAYLPRPAAAAAQPASQFVAAGETPAGLNDGEWQSMQSLIQEAEYQFAWHEPGREMPLPYYWAPNRAQGWRLTFTSHGLSLGPGNAQTGDWQWGLRLLAYGYAGQQEPASGQPAIQMQANRLAYRWSADFEEWYLNSAEGLEQGFSLSQPPAGRASGAPLHINLAVLGDLRARLDASGAALAFLDAAGRSLVHYDHLRVYDALGREFLARFELHQQRSPGWDRRPATKTVLRIVVEDRDAVYPLTVDPLATSQLTKLTAPDGNIGDYFGRSVSLSGNTALVSAPEDDDNGLYSGSAYLFERNQGGADSWSLVKKLNASDECAYDHFGISISLSGDTALIGAYGQDVGPNGNQGAAYIYERNWGGADNWGEVAKLVAADGVTDSLFGGAVSLSGDTALISALWGDGFKGAVYIFERNQGGPDAWGQATKLITPPDVIAVENFGYSVSLDSDTALIGASDDEVDGNTGQGSAYLFQRNQGGANNWGLVKKLTATDGSGDDKFGYSVSLDGGTALIGAYWDNIGGASQQGSVYIFERNQGGADNWGQVTKLTASDGSANNWFGASVSLDGGTALVGAYGGNGYQGSAYLFERNYPSSDGWGQVKKLTDSDGAAYAYFGASVSLDGDTILAGAYLDTVNSYFGLGSVSLFTRDGDEWAQVTRIAASDGGGYDNFGFAVSLSDDIALIGANFDQGAAYLFQRNADGAGGSSPDAWGQVKKLAAADGAANDYFGVSVSLDADRALVGASGDDGDRGAAYLFERNLGGADNWGQFKKLTASDGTASDYFGVSVSLLADRALVGASCGNAANTDQGAVYLFERNSDGAGGIAADNWGQVKKLVASDGANDDRFGYAASLGTDAILVGAYLDDVEAKSDQGSAYLFKRNQGGADNWGQVKKLTAADGAANNYFGISVSLDGDTALVGAYQANSYQGAAYLFERNQGGAENWGQANKLTAFGETGTAYFGRSVSLDGDTALVGAVVADVGAVHSQGAAYVFERNWGGAEAWGQVARLIAFDGAFEDHFGISVSLDDDTALVGAHLDDSAYSNQGSAYFFRRRDAYRKTINTPGPYTLGGDTNLTLYVNSAEACLDGLDIAVAYENHPNAPAPLQTGKYWSITPYGCPEFDIDLTLGVLFTPSASSVLCRYTGSAWDCAADSYDAGDRTITRKHVTQFSDWTGGLEAPTAVTLADFQASPAASSVLLAWSTALELDTLGFDLLRADSPNGPRVQLNPELIPAQAVGGLLGAEYTFNDASAQPGQMYYYWLEVLSLDGRQTFGPLAAQAGFGVYLPVVVR